MTPLTGAALLGAGEAASRAIGMALTVYLVRTLGSESYGNLMVASSLASYVLVLATPGADTLPLREWTRQPGSRTHAAVLRLRGAGGLLALAGVLAAAAVLPMPDAQALLLVLHAALLPGLLLSRHYAWQAEGRHPLVASVRVAQACIYAAGVLALVHGTEDVTLVPLALGASMLAAALLTLPAGRSGPATGSAADVPRLARSAAPMLVASLVILVYTSIDVVMLGWMRGAAEAGRYAAVYRVLMLVTAGAALLLQAHQPALLRAARRPAFRRYMRIMTAAAAVAGGAVLLLSEVALVPLLGADFTDMAAVLRILGLVAVLVYVNVGVASPLQLWRLERRYLLIVAAGAVVNVLLNLWWIPAYGMHGAAWATVAAEGTVLIGALPALRRALALDAPAEPPTTEAAGSPGASV